MSVYAQSYIARNYSTLQGLPSNIVYSVVQDQNGFLWFATDHGVSRFDGKNFKNFTVDDGIGDNEVLGLFLDSRQRLWFTGFNGSLSFYKDGVIYNKNNCIYLKDFHASNYINNTWEDSHANIYFTIFQNVTYCLKANNSFVKISIGEGTPFFEKYNKIYYYLSGNIYTMHDTLRINNNPISPVRFCYY